MGIVFQQEVEKHYGNQTSMVDNSVRQFVGSGNSLINTNING